MILSLSEIMTVPDGVREMDIPLDAPDIRYQDMRYEFREKPPVHVRITNQNKKKVLVEGEADYTLSIPCSRCLELVDTVIPVRVHEAVDFGRGAEDATGADSGEEDGQGFSWLDGYELDVDQMVMEELYLQFPAQVLCREDCSGLCPVCGKNLNLGDCGCSRTTLDPRMAAIQDIFQNFKEV